MITILAGGTGSIKLVRGLKPESIICNVGDNIWLYGLYICPDIDTIIYGLANILARERGWGIKDDTFNTLKQLEMLGVDTWFRVGDKDLATHILRTIMLKEGKRLYEITRYFRDKFNINANIIPSTEDPLETFIITTKGLMHLQEFWVKYRGELEVKGIIYKGIEDARAVDKAVDAIYNSEAIIIAPANPISSINPIISIREINTAIREMRDRCIAVSPVIGKKPISGPAGKYMTALGYEVSPYGVAEFYSNFISRLIIDEYDKDYIKIIEDKFKIKVYTTDIIMRDEKDEQRLADFIKSVI